MKYILTILGLLFLTTAFGQRDTKKSVSKELVENGGQLIMLVNYSIGEASYHEQFIIIEKIGNTFKAKIHIDTSSYFNRAKNFNWSDTVLLFERERFENFVLLEKKMFKKEIKPTYNCNGIESSIIHNNTVVYFYYDKEKRIEGENLQDLSFSKLDDKYWKKSVKSKFLNIYGGFVSIRDELLNLGMDYERCKTYWYD